MNNNNNQTMSDKQKCPHCGAEWIDTAMTFACGSYGRTDGLKRHAKCYERQIAALIQDRDAWKLAAQQCGIYRADTPHDTPELWQSSQLKAITNMMNQIAALQSELEIEKGKVIDAGVYENRVVTFWRDGG